MKILSTPTRPRGVVGVLYGPEGIGKSSLAAALDKPLFLDAEMGAHGLKVATLDEAVTFENVMRLLKELSADHGGYRTLVLDTLDAIETKFLADFIDEHKWNSIEDAGYGKGYVMFAERFVKLLARCREVAESGMNVVLVAHAEVRKFELPDERGAYDRWQLKLSRQVAPKVKECADFIVFLNYKTNIVSPDKKAGETKARATGGRRWCYTAHTPAYDAKCRCFLDLPEECALDDMAKKLPAALRAAVRDPSRPSPDPSADPSPRDAAPERATPKKEAASAPAAEAPSGAARLREALGAYGGTEAALYAKYARLHADRYGEAASIDGWAAPFVDWLLKGFAAGKIKL